MTLTHRPMFQALIEAACRGDDTARALQVFLRSRPSSLLRGAARHTRGVREPLLFKSPGCARVAGMPRVDAAQMAQARALEMRAACRARPVRRAQVFDDWKAFASRAAAGAGDDGEAVPEPRLSNVTLAFLEACCREQVCASNLSPHPYPKPASPCSSRQGRGPLRAPSQQPAPSCTPSLVACWCCSSCCGCDKRHEVDACMRVHAT